MPINSLEKLVGMFPWFLTRDESSNFVKSQSVSNNRFKDIYNSLYDTYLSFWLDKKCLIYKEQTEPYNYIMHFLAGIPLLENVKVYCEADLIYEARFELAEDESYSFMVAEDFHTYTTVEEVVDEETITSITHDIYTETHTIEENITSVNYPHSSTSENIIPLESYRITVTTFDEYTTTKGFPERDEPLTDSDGEIVYDEFDHDVSLDEIGSLNNIPRKHYIASTNYARTEPPYNDRLSEDDYHYMQRMLRYNLLMHTSPLVVAEIFKLYGLEAELINRDRFLCRMFDIFKHPHHYETDGEGDRLFVDEWIPEAWEHKDTFCPGSIFLGEYFYVFASTLQPVKRQSVQFCFGFYNGLFEDLIGDDFTVDIYLNGTPYMLEYTGECIVIPPAVLSDVEDNVFCFHGKQGGRLIGEWCDTVRVRGCTDADFVVRSQSWVESEPSIIMSGETSEIYATFTGSAHSTGQTVYFYEKVEPTFKINMDSQIIQSGETNEFYATVRDEDGSIVKNALVYFFEKVEPVINIDVESEIIQSGDNTDIFTTVKDSDGSIVNNAMVHFYQKTLTATPTRGVLSRKRAGLTTTSNVNSTILDAPAMSLNQALESVNGIYNLIGVFGENIYDGQGVVHEDTSIIGCNNGVLNNFTQPLFFTLDKGVSLRILDLTCNLLDGSVNEEYESAVVDFDVFCNVECDGDSREDNTTSRVLMYNVNYGVLLTDLPDGVSFIKDLEFNTTTGVLSWTEYTLEEFTKYGDLNDVIYDMSLVLDDDVYYYEFVTSRSDAKSLARPFVYLADRKELADGVQTMTYDNTTGVLCLDLNGDEIIWEPKSHLI